MTDISVQTSGFPGLNYTSAAAATTGTFSNDGHTFLLFTNTNASARTLPIAANDTSRPGFGTIATHAVRGTVDGLLLIGLGEAFRPGAAIVTAVWSNSAGGIWQATKRFQISVYSFDSSGPSFACAAAGLKFASVGRIASCASWALLFDDE